MYNKSMELLNEYLKVSSSYRDTYIKNNELIKDNISIEDLYYHVCLDVDIILNNLNVSPSRSGYKYWKDAIFLSIINPKSDISICKDVYVLISKKYNKTYSAVERAMRLCFENVMYYISKSENNIVKKYLKNSLLYPHNREILLKLVELIVSKNFQSNKYKIWF